jgi:hypothetical protein
MSADPLFQSEILNYLQQLGSEDQARVVILARSLVTASKQGTPGQDMLRLIGMIPHDDLDEMKRSIESECERIDLDE